MSIERYNKIILSQFTGLMGMILLFSLLTESYILAQEPYQRLAKPFGAKQARNISPGTGLINVPADYATIQEAFDAAGEGDTILVAPGIYPEAIILSGKSVVLASWFLTSGDSSDISQTVLDGGDGNAVIRIENSVGPSTTIMGFTIQNASDGISPRAKFDILNCRIHSCGDGIDYESGSGGICKYNVFENNSDDGIDLDDDVDIVIEDNIIRNNGDDGIEIRLQSYNGPLVTCIIRRNVIHGNDEDGIQLIDYDNLSDRFFIIERNLIYGNRMAGLGCMGGSNSNENYEGASIPERIYLFHNTFVANEYGVTGGDSLVAVNNIFVAHPGIAMKNVDGGSIVSYGIFWNNGTDVENCNVDYSEILFSDPLLDSLFHLQPTSPAIDAGTALFFWQDEAVLNQPSSSYKGMAPDLGVFEFDPGPTSSIAIDDVKVTEVDTNIVSATFTVTLSPASVQTVTVDFATTDGTATAPDDYNAIATTTLTFAPGTLTQTITVLVYGDTIDEPDESFFVNLSNAVNAAIADDQGMGTIADNYDPQTVSVSFQDGVNGYSGTRDTKLLHSTPDTNYGSATTLESDGSPYQSALLYWDLASIPPGSPIRSADITVHVTNKSDDVYKVYELKRPWVEDEATWNEYASGQNWQVPGADGAADRSSTVLGSIIAPVEGGITISLNSAGIAVVQSWVDNPTANHGLVILDYINTNDGLAFSSRENRTVSKRPKLTVTHDVTTELTMKPVEIPRTSQLKQNYPNPFNPKTKISYSIRKSGLVTLKVYDLLGREVQILVSELQDAGTYSLDFEASNLSSGHYFYVLRTSDGFWDIKKMSLLK